MKLSSNCLFILYLCLRYLLGNLVALTIVDRDMIWGLGERLCSIYANLCTVKTMCFWYNEGIIQ